MNFPGCIRHSNNSIKGRAEGRMDEEAKERVETLLMLTAG